MRRGSDDGLRRMDLATFMMRRAASDLPSPCSLSTFFGSGGRYVSSTSIVRVCLNTGTGSSGQSGLDRIRGSWRSDTVIRLLKTIKRSVRFLSPHSTSSTYSTDRVALHNSATATQTAGDMQANTKKTQWLVPHPIAQGASPMNVMPEKIAVTAYNQALPLFDRSSRRTASHVTVKGTITKIVLITNKTSSPSMAMRDSVGSVPGPLRGTKPDCG